ncbi:MAG: hypothetical protein KGL39_49595 [Patescibacteria group bacterium]|nr:hypothetical protein [Patescibacteria group bacterium]
MPHVQIGDRVYHFGRKPARFDRRAVIGAARMSAHLSTLGPPPTTRDWTPAVTAKVGADWGVMGNDQCGDCVFASGGHSIMARTANAGSIVIPSADDIINAYSAFTGYVRGSESTDNGTNETDFCNNLVTNGLLGHRADATTPIDGTSFDQIKWTVELFGSCLLGIVLPRYAMDQFNNNEAWRLDTLGDQTVLGGHGICIVKYDAFGFYVVTWGRVQLMTYDFAKAWIDEAHATLDFDWMNTMGNAPNALNRTQLESDLKSLPEAA